MIIFFVNSPIPMKNVTKKYSSLKSKLYKDFNTGLLSRRLPRSMRNILTYIIGLHNHNFSGSSVSLALTTNLFQYVPGGTQVMREI